MKKFILAATFLFFCYVAKPQCTTASFILADTACSNSILPIVNTSAGAGFNYQWDLWPNDLQGPVQVGGSLVINSHFFNSLTSFKVFKDNNAYYFMAYDTALSQFVQASYTGALQQISIGAQPTGNDNTILSYPKANCFDMIKDDSTWYGVAGYAPNDTLILLTFSNGLLTAPIATAIPAVSNLNKPYGIKLLKLDHTYYALITNHGDSTLSCISFGNSMTNVPTQLYKTHISGAAGLCDIDVEPICNSITGFSTNTNSAVILRYDWGSSITNPPTVSSIGPYSASGKWGVAIAHDGEYYYTYYAGFSSDTIYRLSYHNDFSSTPVNEVVRTNYPGVTDIQFFSDSSKSMVFYFDDTYKAAYDLYYSPFFSGTYFSTDSVPLVSYPLTGNDTITYTLVDSNGYVSSVTHTTVLIPGPTSAFTFIAGCANDSVSFTDNSTTPNGTITAWSWDFGDGNSSPLKNPKHQYAAGGNYSVTLAITNSTGCTSLSTQSVSIKYLPVPTFQYITACAKSGIVFTDQSTISSGTIQSWQWNFGDATTSAVQNPVHVYNLGGTYNVHLVVQSDLGCVDSIILPVNVMPTPQISFTVANTCSTDTVQFTNTTTIIGGGNINYVWDFGDLSATTNAVNPTHHYSSAGTYTITLIAQAANGCSDTLIQNVILSSPATPNFSFTNNVCEKNPASFTDLSTGNLISGWTWIFGDGDTAFTQNPSHIYLSSGTFTVTLIVTVGSSCNASVSQQITIASSPTANFSASRVCEGNITFFHDSSSAPIGSFVNSWLWHFGDGDSATTQFAQHAYASAGIYNATLQVTSNTGCPDTASVQVIVDALPQVLFTTLGLQCTGTPIQFEDLSTVLNDSITAWHWDFNDGFTSSLQNPTHSFSTGGTKIVELDATSSAGCTNIGVFTVNVHQSPQFIFTAAQGCLGDSTQFNYIVTGISAAISYVWNFGDSGAAFLPNPKHLYQLTGNFGVSLTVLDSSGCSATYMDTVGVSPKPNAAFIYYGICQLAPDSFFDQSSSANIVSWNWDFGDGQNSSSQNPVYAFQDSGSYNVTLIVTADAGCMDSVTQNISIQPTPVASFTSPLYGTPLTNNIFSGTGNSSYQYNWNFGDSTFSTLQNPTHAYADTGTYSVSLIMTNNYGCIDTAFSLFNVLVPYLDLAMRNVNATVNSGLLSITAEIINDGNIPAFNYTLEPQVENSGELTNEFIVDSIYPSNAKLRTLATRFHVNENALPSYFCVNIVGVNNGIDAVLSNNFKCGVLSSEFEVAQIYPNPNNGNVTLQFTVPVDDNVTIELFDARGRKISDLLNQQESKGYHNAVFYLQHISRGIYFLKIMYRDQVLYRRFCKN